MAETDVSKLVIEDEFLSSDQQDHEQPSTSSTRQTVKRKQSDDDGDDEDSDSNADQYLKDNTHGKVIASHYNTLEEKGIYERTKSKIFYMRNYNNWIKSMLINEFMAKLKEKSWTAPVRVLDIGCGKGGDLLKWSKANITHIICTDLAEVSLEQCEARYKKINSKKDVKKPFTAEFFACDATKTRLRSKYLDPSIELDLVSCQFAFHYCFETLQQAECMLKNASECLRVGGYFIGTIPDANEIMKRRVLSKSEEFGNDVYEISILWETEQPPFFGAKYNFRLDNVVDCPEFLVHFPVLEKLALKFGLKLVMKKRFEEYHDDMIKSGRFLIEKMQSLETYPAFNKHYQAEQTDESYSHAKKYIDNKMKYGNYRRPFRVGTISQSEWEAISIYMVFAFEKIKT
uniref:mRNA cap guanine-N(7) methyltransferase n=1 Tax=Corethrella appendiculata TaxID=1370023 RepID=U5ERD1_9DIPT